MIQRTSLIQFSHDLIQRCFRISKNFLSPRFSGSFSSSALWLREILGDSVVRRRLLTVPLMVALTSWSCIILSFRELGNGVGAVPCEIISGNPRTRTSKSMRTERGSACSALFEFSLLLSDISLMFDLLLQRFETMVTIQSSKRLRKEKELKSKEVGCSTNGLLKQQKRRRHFYLRIWIFSKSSRVPHD